MAKRRSVVQLAQPFVWSTNHETDSHICGLEQGQEPACKVPYFDWERMSKLKIGELYEQSGCWSSPPAVGKRVYRILRSDENGIWGEIVSDSVRVLSASEVM